MSLGFKFGKLITFRGYQIQSIVMPRGPEGISNSHTKVWSCVNGERVVVHRATNAIKAREWVRKEAAK